MTNKVTRTAPKRIWLNVSDEREDCRASFPPVPDESLTWCHDSVVACEVEYVRADLVRAAMPANWMDEPETRALGKALHMTANDMVSGGGTWNRKERPRVDTHPTQAKLRWEQEA